MTNHIHIAIEVDRVPLSSILHNVCSRYASWFNRKYSRTGHLFERRYRSGLIETNDSACRLVRYIHLNPVQAGLVADPSDYLWCSHRGYVGGTSVPWLETRRVLALFGESAAAARRHFSEYVTQETGEIAGVQDELHLTTLLEDERQEDPAGGLTSAMGDGPLGPPIWQLASLDELLEAVTAHEKVDLSGLLGRSQKRTLAEARAIAAYLARRCQRISTGKIAGALKRDSSTVIRAAEGMGQRIGGSASLRLRVERIQIRLADGVRKRT